MIASLNFELIFYDIGYMDIDHQLHYKSKTEFMY